MLGKFVLKSFWGTGMLCGCAGEHVCPYLLQLRFQVTAPLESRGNLRLSPSLSFEANFYPRLDLMEYVS